MKTLPERNSPQQTEMGILDHLRELRHRLVISMISILIGSIIAYTYSREILDILVLPFNKTFPHDSLIGTGPAEAFLLRIKVAIFSGVVMASPIIFYEVWLFIAPGLYPTEKRLLLPFTLISTALFLGGLWFCLTVIFPFALEFFRAQYTEIGIKPTIKVGEYLSSVITAMLGFGAVFEMPVAAYFLGKLGVIDDHTLISGVRYAVVIIFIVSAILTPPDVITQLLMAGPLLLLYGVSILVVKYCK